MVIDSFAISYPVSWGLFWMSIKQNYLYRTVFHYSLGPLVKNVDLGVCFQIYLNQTSIVSWLELDDVQ